MICETYISTTHDEEKHSNGLNLKIYRCDNSKSIEIMMVEDGEKTIMQFSILFEEFEKTYRVLSIIGDE
jgi:hypothetical protein